MPRDYARNTSRRANRPEFGRWRWPLALLLIALFAAGILFLKKQSEKLAATAQNGTDNSIIKSTLKNSIENSNVKDAANLSNAAKNKPATPPATTMPQPKFDFYTTLSQPGQTTATTTPSTSANPPATTPAATPPINATTSDKKSLQNHAEQDAADLIAMEIKKLNDKEKTTTKPKTVSNGVKTINNYILQLGSFKNYNDADQMKAQLLLQGLEVTLQPIKKGEITLYRVIMGPYSNLNTAKEQQHTLETNQIKSRIVKE